MAEKVTKVVELLFQVVGNFVLGKLFQIMLHNPSLKKRHSTLIVHFTLEVFVLELSIKEKKIAVQITTEMVYIFKQSFKQS